MNETLTGLAVGIPLALASFAGAWLLIRAVVQAADKPGLNPLLVALTLLAILGMVLFATNPEGLTELAAIASVAVGALAGSLSSVMGGNQDVLREGLEPGPLEDEEIEDLTYPIDGAEGIAPEDVEVPADVEELGK